MGIIFPYSPRSTSKVVRRHRSETELGVRIWHRCNEGLEFRSGLA